MDLQVLFNYVFQTGSIKVNSKAMDNLQTGNALIRLIKSWRNQSVRAGELVVSRRTERRIQSLTAD
jgi:hypothetical protein